MTIKSGETFIAIPTLSTIASVDSDESGEPPSRPLAPLASSETFSDVAALANDDQPAPAPPAKANPPSSTKGKTTKSDFDSLEVLFDFPSSGISSDAQLDVADSSRVSNPIRSSTINQTVTTEKVRRSNLEIIFSLFNEEQKVLRIEKLDSPSNQQRSRLDSTTTSGNTQADQATSQNVLWLCEKLIGKENSSEYAFLSSS